MSAADAQIDPKPQSSPLRRRARANPISRKNGRMTLQLGRLNAGLQWMHPLSASATEDPVIGTRRAIADFYRLVGRRIFSNDRRPDLAPRLQQTLLLLLNGDSEKQVAQRLNLSKHTVHVYVKSLYKQYGVSTRAELLAKHLS